MGQPQKKYSLFTAIAMIVGTVIGSGIFFKSASVLEKTGGSLLLGAALFALCALGIVFGGLTIGQLACRTDRPGGVLAYLETYADTRTACGFGWFQVLLYYPSLIAVIAWVAAAYLQDLFGMQGGLETQILTAAVLILALFGLNNLSARAGGLFQNATAVVKLIPLAGLTVLGFLYGDPAALTAAHGAAGGPSLMRAAAAIPAVAFMFDGWVVATSVCAEIKASKRTLPLALAVAPACILAVYVLYFIGAGLYLGPDAMAELGDGYIYAAAAQALGRSGGTVVLAMITAAVLGTVNGYVIGAARMPYALAQAGFCPCPRLFARTDGRTDIPLPSAAFACACALLMLGLHYLIVRLELLPGYDVSEIAVAVSYLLYSILYIRVIALYRKGEIRGVFHGLVFPLLALTGAAVVVLGAAQSRMFWLNLAVCAAVFFGGFLYCGRTRRGGHGGHGGGHDLRDGY